MIDLSVTRSMEWIQTRTNIKSVRRTLAFVVAVLSIINILTVFFPVRRGRAVMLFVLLNQYAPFAPSGKMFLYTGQTLGLLLGFFLFLLASGLLRGKERAWQFAIGLLPLAVLAHLMKGLNIECALLLTIIWIGLLFYRSSFRVESDPWSMRQGVIFLLVGFALLLLYLLAGYYILQDQLAADSIHAVLRTFLRRMINLPPLEAIPETHMARGFLNSIPWLSSAILFVGMILLLRPVSGRWWLHYQQEKSEWLRQKADELISSFGTQTLSFFALSPSNLRYISPTGEGVVNYRLVGDIALLVGDPVAAPGARERVMRDFLTLCARKDWRVAVYQAQPAQLQLYRNLGLSVLKIGEEALLNPQTFTTSGSAMANVRTSSRRAEREGVSIEWYEGEPPAEVQAQLKELSQTWLASKSGKQGGEMGFSMGQLAELTESGRRSQMVADLHSDAKSTTPRLVLGVARNNAGQPCAFVSFTPIYGLLQTEDNGGLRSSWGWALDLMRRVPEAPPGVMELLIVRAMERFRSAGAEAVSLGLVACADSRQEMSSRQQQIARMATDHIQMLEAHRSLQKFKQKFQPCWESRYVVSSNTLSLPKVALALLRAHKS